MKKVLALLAIAMLLCGVSYAAYVDVSKDISISINITGDFGLQIPDPQMQIQAMSAGLMDSNEAACYVIAGSSYADPWTITIKGENFVSGTNTYDPSSAAEFANTGLGFALPSGEIPKGTSPYQTIPGLIKKIPVSAADLYYTPNVDKRTVGHAFFVTLDGNAPSLPQGTYTSKLTLLMKANPA